MGIWAVTGRPQLPQNLLPSSRGLLQCGQSGMGSSNGHWPWTPNRSSGPARNNLRAFGR
jgi:hypothetical protein